MGEQMRTLLSIVGLAVSLSGAVAQTPVFDMAPEREESAPDVSGTTPTADPAGTIESTVAAKGALAKRHLLQEPTIRLQGEIAVREWSFDLTPAQASSPAEFALSYVNSIVVAPETSQLVVKVNDTVLFEEMPRGAERERRRIVKVPSDVLTAGSNSIRFEAEHRHRTDCTINSTYDLWTDISAENTYLQFNAENANQMVSIRDIVAIGTDTTGLTRFHMVVPGLTSADMADIALRISQKLAVISGSESPFFTFGDTLPETVGQGELVVIVGTADEVSSLLPGNFGTDEPVAGAFFPLPETGEHQALVFSAENVRALRTSVDGVGAQGLARKNTVPFVASSGSSRFTFTELGVSASQFFGRRFFTSLKFGMPADFFASNYGVARILLDAAYSSDVLPGGSFNVIVNGNLGTTVPITSAGGAVLQKYPIRVPMRHLMPGINTISIEAFLPTDIDNSCVPGAGEADTPRFALFGTSELIIPSFAQAKRVPDLAGWAAFAEPLNETGTPFDLSLGRYDELTVSAAATVLAKLARAAGAELEFQLVAPEIRGKSDNMIFIGAVDQMPAELVEGVVLTSAAEGAAADEQLNDENLELWNDRVARPRVVSWFSNIGAWLRENFNLDQSSIWFWAGNEDVYNLPSTADTFFYQSVDSVTGAVRTAISAPSDVQLVNGAEAFARQTNWSQIRGVVSYHDNLTNEVVSLEPMSPRFQSVDPLTFANLRLVLTNWLASNFVLYSLLLLLSAVLVGFATNKLLGVLGRGHEKHE